MNFKLFLSSFLLTALVLFTSCKEPIDIVDNELHLEIEVQNVTESSVDVDVLASNEDGAYFVSVAKQSDMDAAESYAMFIKETVSGLKENGSLEVNNGSVIKSFKDLESATEYVAFAVVLGSNLDATEEIETVDFITEEGEEPEENYDWEKVTFEIEVNNLTASNADLDIKSSDAKIPFFGDIVSEKVYVAYQLNTEEGIANYISLLFSGLAEKYEMSVKDVYKQLVAKGELHRNYTSLPAAQKYYAYSVAIYCDGQEVVAKTGGTIYEFTTPEPEESDLTISFETLKEAPFSGRIKFIPSNPNSYYFYEFWEAENIDFYGLDDQGVIDHFVKHWGDYFDILKVRGEQVYYREDMLQNTEYVALAFGIENGRPNTKLFKHTFNTLPSITPDKQTFDITVSNIQSISAEIHYEPWDPTVTYAFEIVPKAEYDAASDKKAYLQDYYNALLDYYVSQTPFNREQAIEILSEEGSYTYNISFLDPETEYYAWAVAIDKKDATFLSEVAIKEFKTTKMEYSTAKAEAHINEYFDGDALAAYDSSFDSFAGKAIFSFDVKLEGDVQVYYATLLGGDITNQYEDSELYAQIISSGVKNPTAKDIMAAPFDTKFTICSFAVDSDAKYGKIYREVKTLNRAGASDPENFFKVSPSTVSEPMSFTQSFINHRVDVPYRPADDTMDLRSNLRKKLDAAEIVKTRTVISAADLFEFNERM